MSKRTFTCCECKRTMESDWSEEEAKAEFAANFPGIPFEEAGDPLCDECHDKFWKWAETEAPELERKK